MGGRYALLSIMRTLAREEMVKIINLENETSLAKDRLNWHWLGEYIFTMTDQDNVSSLLTYTYGSVTEWGAEYQVCVSPDSSTKGLIYQFSMFNVGDMIYVRTNKDADNFKIARFDVAQESIVLEDVVPEQMGHMMTMALPIKGNLLALVYHWEVRHGIPDVTLAFAYYSWIVAEGRYQNT